MGESIVGRKVKITKGDRGIPDKYIGQVGTIGENSSNGKIGLTNRALEIIMEDGEYLYPNGPDAIRPQCEWYTEPVKDKEYSIENIRDKKIAIDVKSEEEYKQCLQIFEDAGILWSNGSKATHLNYYEEDKHDTYLSYEPTRLWRQGRRSVQYDDDTKIITAAQFIADNTKDTGYTVEEAIAYARGKKVAIYCPTQEIWNQVIKYEATDRGTMVTSKNWSSYEEDSCINVNNGKFTFGDTTFYEKEGYEIITIKQPTTMNDKQQLQAQIEQMEKSIQEMKKKVQEIDNPVYKVGDWVTCIVNKAGNSVKGAGWNEGKVFQIGTDNYNGSEQCVYPKGEAGVYISHVRKATPEEIAAANIFKLPLGTEGREVTVSKEKIVAHDGTTVYVPDLKHLIEQMGKVVCQVNTWSVEIKTVKIGCTDKVELSQLKAIYDQYKALQD